MSRVTRWKPRRVFCTEDPNHRDEPGVEHVVKFRQGKVGTAALISEVLCGGLLDAGGALALVRSVAKVHQSARRLADAIARVPLEWWRETGVDSQQLRNGLESRSRRIAEILNIRQWESVFDDIQGGHLL